MVLVELLTEDIWVEWEQQEEQLESAKLDLVRENCRQDDKCKQF